MSTAWNGIGTAPSPSSVAPRGRLASGVVMPVRDWSDSLSLGVTEIRECDSASVAVVRRPRALLEELRALVDTERRAAVDDEIRRLDATVAAQVAGSADLDPAPSGDAQGIGGPAPALDADARASSGQVEDRA